MPNIKLKNTKQRQQILEFLENAKMPLSAEEIFKEVKTILPNIAISTIYRNLETLLSKNIVRKTMFGDGIARYEAFSSKHKHYLVCVNCNKMISIPDCPLSEIENNLEKTTDFYVLGHSLEIYGKCPECKIK